jgi:hypothetical protein
LEELLVKKKNVLLNRMLKKWGDKLWIGSNCIMACSRSNQLAKTVTTVWLPLKGGECPEQLMGYSDP